VRSSRQTDVLHSRPNRYLSLLLLRSVAGSGIQCTSRQVSPGQRDVAPNERRTDKPWRCIPFGRDPALTCRFHSLLTVAGARRNASSPRLRNVRAMVPQRLVRRKDIDAPYTPVVPRNQPGHLRPATSLTSDAYGLNRHHRYLTVVCEKVTLAKRSNPGAGLRVWQVRLAGSGCRCPRGYRRSRAGRHRRPAKSSASSPSCPATSTTASAADRCPLPSQAGGTGIS
jgi:hypothetical protein